MNPLTPGAIQLLTKLASFPLPLNLPPPEARWRQFATYLLQLNNLNTPDELAKLYRAIGIAIHGIEQGVCNKTQYEETIAYIDKFFVDRGIRK